MAPKIVFTFPYGDASMREQLKEAYKEDAELVFENCGSSEEKIISAEQPGTLLKKSSPVSTS